jgi:hypothetical protein
MEARSPLSDPHQTEPVFFQCKAIPGDTQYGLKELDFLPTMEEYGKRKGKRERRLVFEGICRGNLNFEAVLPLGNWI